MYQCNKVTVKWSRYRPGMAQRVGRGIALLFHDRGTRRGWVVSSTPRPHLTPEKDTVPILQEAEWAARPVWTGGKSRPHRDSIADRPARSHSLYRMSYRAHIEEHNKCLKMNLCIKLFKKRTIIRQTEVHHFKSEILLTNAVKFSFYRSENTTYFYYKKKYFVSYRNNGFYTGSSTYHKNTRCKQNEYKSNVTAGGTYRYHRTLNS